MTDQLAFAVDDAMTAPAGDDASPVASGSGSASSPVPPTVECARRISRLDSLTRPSPDDRPATLLGCVAWLSEQLGPGDPEFKQTRGAVRTVLTVITKRANPGSADLPADPPLLRAHLIDAMPAAMAVSRSRWDNAKSLLKSLLIVTGWVSRDARPFGPISANLEGILAAARAQQIGTCLRPFLRFAERHGVPPVAISADTVAAYEAWLIAETLEFRPRQVVISVGADWRRLQRLCPEWPRQQLTLPSRVWQKAHPYSAFPSSFQADVEAYLAALRSPDPLDKAQGRPLAEISVQHARRYLMRAATCLMQSGTPSECITSIAVLVEPAAFRAIALSLHAEGMPLLKAAGETAQWTCISSHITLALLQAARRWVKLAAEPLIEITALQRRIKPRRGGLSDRVQDALAELTTDAERAELHALPWRAFEMADAMLRTGDFRRAAKLHETALALAIVLLHPLRAGDLVALDPAKHFLHDRRGRVHQVFVRASKNKSQVRFEVHPELADRIARHLDVFRPRIEHHGETTALFPGENGKPRETQSLGRLIRRLVANQLGKAFTMHMARHLAVDMILDDDPSNIPGAQRLLGNKTPKVTLTVYGPRATLAANRKYGQLIREQAARAGLPESVPRGRKARSGKR